MRKQRQDKNKWNRHAYEIQQYGTHDESPDVRLSGPYVIALSPTDGRGIARAECAHHERKEKPQQKMRGGFARGVLALPGVRDDVAYTLFRFRQGNSGPGGDQVRQVGLVC